MRIGILFDLDGTLLDTLEDLKDATNYALACYGCPERSLEEVRRFVGSGARELIAKALPGGENDPGVDAVLETYRTYYAGHCQVKTRPYDGVLESLAELGKEYPIAIVSNKPDPAVKKLCREYFGGVYARGEASDCPRKPAPDMVFKAMAEIGVESCVYVGDSEVDVQTGKNAGVPVLSVLWGFRDRDILQRAGADRFCRTAAELPACLRGIIKEIEERNGQ